MNSVDQPVRRPMHPVVIAAAVGIIALSAVGISVLLYNRSEAQSANPAMVASASSSDGAVTASANTVAPPPAGFDNTAPVPGSTPGSAPAPTAMPASAEASPPVGAASGVPIDANGAPLGANAVPPGALPPPSPGMAQTTPPQCVTCAIVVGERAVTVQGRGTGLGAVGGGVAGGLIGNSIGHGRGNVAMTLLGAAGGALAGNAIEEHARSRTEYQMTVRFPDGRERSFIHTQPWSYQVGQAVRVEHGRVLALNQ